MAIPSGWMPVVDANGAVMLAPCPGAQPGTSVGHGGEHSNHDNKGHSQSGNDGDCAFAPLQAGFDLSDAARPLPPLLGLAPHALAPSPYRPRGPPAPPPRATGPPLNA